MDGACLLNATYFDNTTDGMLISSIVNAGSKTIMLMQKYKVLKEIWYFS